MATYVWLNNASFWLLHLNDVAFWTLLSLCCLLGALRLLSLFALARRGYTPIPMRSWAMLLSSAGLAGGFGGFGYLAVRPEPQFYSSLGNSAWNRQDCRGVIQYYGTLAWWGSDQPEIHARLATCYSRIGDGPHALSSLETALALPGGDTLDARLFGAALAEAQGRTQLALLHLAQAERRATDPAQRTEIAKHADALRAKAGATR